jgi:hypothetical protein
MGGRGSGSMLGGVSDAAKERPQPARIKMWIIADHVQTRFATSLFPALIVQRLRALIGRASTAA